MSRRKRRNESGSNHQLPRRHARGSQSSLKMPRWQNLRRRKGGVRGTLRFRQSRMPHCEDLRGRERRMRKNLFLLLPKTPKRILRLLKHPSWQSVRSNDVSLPFVDPVRLTLSSSLTLFLSRFLTAIPPYRTTRSPTSKLSNPTRTRTNPPLFRRSFLLTHFLYLLRIPQSRLSSRPLIDLSLDFRVPHPRQTRELVNPSLGFIRSAP